MKIFNVVLLVLNSSACCFINYFHWLCHRLLHVLFFLGTHTPNLRDFQRLTKQYAYEHKERPKVQCIMWEGRESKEESFVEERKEDKMVGREGTQILILVVRLPAKGSLFHLYMCQSVDSMWDTSGLSEREHDT